MRVCCLVLAVVCFTSADLAIGQPDKALFSDLVLTKAFENGCSLVIAQILAVREQEKMFYYKARIIQTIVPGDLSDDDMDYPLELFAGASYGNALKPNSTYALFIVKECPYYFCWAFRDDIIQIDISDKAGLKALTDTAQTAYAKTSISTFRRKIPSIDLQPPVLSEDLISLCRQFRENPADRAEPAEKIYASDLGSRRDESNPLSSTISYLPPKILLSRGQLLSLLGNPTLISGWTYSWLCGQPGGRGWAGRDVCILSATFDADERAVCVLYGEQKKSKWTKFERAVNELIALGPKPEAVMLQFQRALAERQWQKAIECCSEAVRNKASTYSSLETFFSEYVPVDKLVQLEQFPSEGYSSTSGVIGKIHLSVTVTKPEEGVPPVKWDWMIVKFGENWQIDFGLVPVARLIEKETWRRKLEQENPQSRMTKFERDIEFRLTALSKDFVIGQPILFRLDMINNGDSPIMYMHGPLMVNDPMTITDPNGESVKYVDTSYQTVVRDDVILPRETILLEDNYDVTFQYGIILPGHYTFQFKGWAGEVKRSNIVELDVKTGTPSPTDSIYKTLSQILPEGWTITRRKVDGTFFSANPSDEVVSVHFIGKQLGKAVDVSISLLIFLGDGQLSTNYEYTKEFEHWGRCKYGTVYANIHNAETLWHEYKEQISKALSIE